MVGFFRKTKVIADLARRDAMLSHRADAVEASAYIAALCALIPVSSSREEAVEAALDLIDKNSLAYEAVEVAKNLLISLHQTCMIIMVICHPFIV